MSPIKHENKARYPANWLEIRKRILKRAGNRCECTGECGSPHSPTDYCGAPNGEVILRDRERPWYWTQDLAYDNEDTRAVKVVLTIAHLDHQPENCSDDNLLALCQLCHLRLDRYEHARNAAQTRRKKKKTMEMAFTNKEKVK